MDKVKYLRLISDVHLDHEMAPLVHQSLKLGQPTDVDRLMHLLWQPSVLPEDHETILVIAGDIWINMNHLRYVNTEGETWIEMVAKRFHSVVLVHGNHDYWGSNIDLIEKQAQTLLDQTNANNVHILYNSAVEIGDYRFIGCPLWTDMNKGHPLITSNWTRVMEHDHRFIKQIDKSVPVFEACDLRLERILEEHRISRAFLTRELRTDHDKKVIVVTHMGPSDQSVHPRYRFAGVGFNPTNYYYFSELSDLILDTQPYLWLHGHSHHTCAYWLDDTLVAINAKGYLDRHDVWDKEKMVTETYWKGPEQYTNFEPNFRLELATREGTSATLSSMRKG